MTEPNYRPMDLSEIIERTSQLITDIVTSDTVSQALTRYNAVFDYWKREGETVDGTLSIKALTDVLLYLEPQNKNRVEMINFYKRSLAQFKTSESKRTKAAQAE